MVLGARTICFKEVNDENIPIEECPKVSFQQLRRQCLESWRDRTFDMISTKIEEQLAKGSRCDRVSLSKHLKKDSLRRLPKKAGQRLYRFPDRKRKWNFDVADEKAPEMEAILIKSKMQKVRKPVGDSISVPRPPNMAVPHEN